MTAASTTRSVVLKLPRIQSISGITFTVKCFGYDFGYTVASR
jgi:hypothetical protein